MLKKDVVELGFTCLLLMLFKFFDPGVYPLAFINFSV
jgi:hypothetical protein